MKDVVFIVADQEMRRVVEALVSERAPSLRVPKLDVHVVVHANRDSGVFVQGGALSTGFVGTAKRCMVMLDAAWEGAPSAKDIKVKIEKDLAGAGWQQDACAAVVIEPELEAWCFSPSPHLATALQWTLPKTPVQWLQDVGEQFGANGKPRDPKAALERLVRETRVRLSPRWFSMLAGSNVGLDACVDASFLHFKNTLVRWFGAPART